MIFYKFGYGVIIEKVFGLFTFISLSIFKEIFLTNLPVSALFSS